jgi:molybdenum cofactor guanylyltransferase
VLTGVVLAGGTSRRMGQPKALLSHGGAPLIQARIACLSEVVDRVAVLVGPHRDLLRPYCGGARLLDDSGNGPAAALRGAMRQLGAPLLAIPVDMPNLSPDLLRAFLAAAGDGAVLGPHPNPFPALLPSSFLQIEEQRLVRCVEVIQLPRIDLSDLGNFAPEQLLDTNRPEDWMKHSDF